ncbi:MAG: hypothetical protein GY696_00960 [Gammaproteobacteria bacterium]|nr:hypothetical protein [Gammaproteobacteria bacterium]
MMIQSSHRFSLAASSPTLSESGFDQWAAVLGLAIAVYLGPFRLREPSHPTRQTGFRQMWQLAADRTCWLN